jgi:DNA-directed RNA polymerase subunit alpha
MLSGDEITVALNKEEKKNALTAIQAEEEKKPPLKVVDLNLSTRLTNALLRSGFDDLRKLEGLTEEELANIRGMGSKSFTELLEIVKKFNIKLI